MAEAQEYWNIPKIDEVLSIPQGTNLTVFVDHVDSSLFWGLGASDVTAIASVLVAIIALSVSIWQGCIARRHNVLSVRPSLSFVPVINQGEDIEGINKSYSLFLVNNGVGLAIIKDFRIILNGNCIYERGNNFLSDKNIDIRTLIIRELITSWDRNVDNMESTTFDAGNSIPAKEKVKLLSFDFKASSNEEFSTMINKISYVIEYEDLYGTKTEELTL